MHMMLQIFYSGRITAQRARDIISSKDRSRSEW
jgi:hypothetical protein